jgi:phosphoacetylglucosamine mutase
MCSFDGDGDRIVFHAFLQDKWVLLDGDKIAVLISTFLGRELSAANLADKISFGVVQTAYANGASTKFLRAQGISVYMAKTGVKFVHHKALEFDVGVYFEANGHGTVVFSALFEAQLAAAEVETRNQQCTGVVLSESEHRCHLAVKRLRLFLSLVNQSVGDALSDMLCCLISLQLLNMDLSGWHNMYVDIPSKQQKVAVRDKLSVRCSEDETHLLNPVALQEDLQTAMDSVNEGRCFIRPSGTEDVVRIYAEASTAVEAESLAAQAQQAIEKHLA